MKRLLALAAVLLLAPLAALRAGDVKLAPLFSDHVILQRGMPVPIWGSAAPGESVRVTLAGQSTTAVADNTGRWRVVFEPLQAGGPGELVAQGKTSATIRDVQVGEVWLCGGDAFMSKSISATAPARGERTAQTFPPIRLFRAALATAKEPPPEVTGSWTVCDGRSIGGFPAIAYLFAKELHAAAHVPIGIVEVTDPLPVNIQRGGRVSGSTVEAWISEPTLRGTVAAQPIFEFYRSASELREALAAYQEALTDWKVRNGKSLGADLRELEKREPDVWYDYVAEMKKAGKAVPSEPPRKPTAESLRMATTHAANLYHGMIAPLAGCAVRGVALSLGAANAPRAVQYRSLFPALIRDWRKAWAREDLPILYLQQARATHPSMDPRAWAELREAQAAATRMPRTAMAPAIDLVATGSPFPEDVRTLARRLALAARCVAYGEAVNHSGPVLEKVRFEGGKAIVQFRAVRGTLAVRAGDKLRGFALAERPNRWACADARIEGDRVVVTHRKLTAPVAVRYDWITERGKEGNLTDADGLPAQPFRSDDWPALADSPAALKPNAAAPLQPTDLYPVEDPSLPRVLLIGDSIMNGYTPFVIEALRGRANVNRLVAFGLVGQNEAGVANLVDQRYRLKEGQYAVIHYNDGLHSLPPRITDAQYAAGLRATLSKLKTVAPRVIWATTTPAPDRRNTLGPESQNAAVVTRNAISKQIATELGVPVNDLYELVIGQREQLQGFANLHFNPEGSKRMGQQVAAQILAALQAQPKTTAEPVPPDASRAFAPPTATAPVNRNPNRRPR